MGSAVGPQVSLVFPVGSSACLMSSHQKGVRKVSDSGQCPLSFHTENHAPSFQLLFLHVSDSVLLRAEKRGQGVNTKSQ